MRGTAVATGALAVVVGLLGACGKGESPDTKAAAHPTAQATKQSQKPSPSVSPNSKKPTRAQQPASRDKKRVTNPKVTMIGDSITVRSTPSLQAALPGITIDGQVGRQLTTAPGLVQQHLSSMGPNDVLVIALGTNGNGGLSDFDTAISEAGNRKVVLVNTDCARPWTASMNRTIQQAVRSHANVSLADWHATIAGKEGALLVDGVHPGPQGQQLFARTVANAVHKAVN
ncbi:hypothetical protein [Actinocatenispora sera]|uniref:Uncharacterized protein n=1 Tax=Actinocatenispora sera TaxID=390989 RepID=A0A810KU15_9ACTN|nr:hypothetical protein [Actinocatenispora sera]BCJ26504.1 hypothetical protein Asera_06120 [Actinocatenispora sera]